MKKRVPARKGGKKRSAGTHSRKAARLPIGFAKTYRDIVELAVVGIFRSSQGRFLTANAALARILGYDTVEELLRVDIARDVFRDPNEGFGLLAELEDVAGIFRTEPVLKKKDGSTIPVQLDVRAVRDAKGRTIGHEGFVHDITERRRAEEALRSSEERFRSMVENSHEVIGLLDREGRWVYASPSMFRFGGYTMEELLATKRFGERVHPEDVEAVAKRFFSLVAGAEGPEAFEFRYRRKDGAWLVVEAVLVNRLETPGVGAIVGNFHDVTKRKQAEEQRTRILERVSDAFVALDTDWRYTYVNARAAQIFGRRREDLVGKHIWTEFPEGIGQPFYNAYYRAVEEQAPMQIEEYYPPYDRWFENRIYPSRDGLSIFFQDITERKKSEQELTRSYAELRALAARTEAVRENEASRIAHELHDEIGQALTVIKIQLRTLQQRPDAAPIREDLAEAIGTSERALEQVRDLSLALRPSVLDDLGLPAALRWYLDRQAQISGFAGEFSADVPPARLPRALETACFRVGQQALTNVARHARARRVSVELRREKADLWLSVRDDGVGFDVAAARARALGGESLGILGMEERVSQLGGAFELRSGPSGGTEVRVRFPVPSEAASAGDP